MAEKTMAEKSIPDYDNCVPDEASNQFIFNEIYNQYKQLDVDDVFDETQSNLNVPNHQEEDVDASGNKTPTKDDKIIKKLHEGMMFDTIDEARKYYEDYGRQEGFWIYTRSSKKTWSRSDEITNILYVCAHYGRLGVNKEKEKVRELCDDESTSEFEIDEIEKCH